MILFTILFTSISSFAQSEVVWDFSYDTENSKLVMKANISEGWHLYSQVIDNEIGPIPTEFEFAVNDSYLLVGSPVEPAPIVEYDPNFEGELNFFKDEVVFKQEIQNKNAETVDGMVTYMVCNETMCMPPIDVKFTIALKD